MSEINSHAPSFTHPLPKSARIGAWLLLVALIALFSGCARINYTEIKTDGTKTEFHATTFFANRKLSKLGVAKKTEKTSQGLSLGSSEDDVSVDGIQAVGDVGEKLGRGFATGLAKGIKGTP